MKILFVIAHLDDESFGPAGTIAKLSEKNEVVVLSLCKGDRLRDKKLSKKRIESFKQSSKILNFIPIIKNNTDLELEEKKCHLDIEQSIKEIKPEIVYTHNISDIHAEHRMVSNSCLVSCRPKYDSVVRELYMFETVASTEWAFHQIEPIFTPNVYVNITNYYDLKVKSLSLYDTEIYSFPDARSIKSVDILSSYRGRQIGVEKAEAFKLIFSLDQKTL